LWPMPASWQADAADFPHEAACLKLDSSLAAEKLQWHRKWPLTEALRHTVDWHLAWRQGDDMQAFCRKQIAQYDENSGST